MSTKIVYSGGIGINIDGKWVLLDPIKMPSFKPDIIIISHAHRDHYNIRVLNAFPNIPLILSNETYSLIARSNKLRSEDIIKTEESYMEVNSISLEFFDANHILGSRQILINGEIAYTGDICLEKRIIFKPPEILKAEILIIEATYGNPLYIFPERKILYRQLLKKVIKDYFDRGKAVVYARSPGVAQELIKLFSKLRVNVYAHRTVYAHTQIYTENGCEITQYKIIDSSSEEGIYIYPIWMGKNDIGNGIFVTGWAAVEKDERFIPLSSHSGLNMLLAYVNTSNPQKIYTIYGYARNFSAILKQQGYDAESLW